ncbi:hypothetical protein [Levilactobacillus spicheri]|uniref:Uncharacterized protein n=2 Tax=Levilactobacillus spicheri TaxID=216463 RepID=A0ABQ0WM49_9LACO|nr:hypothetical protein [Levilactobacillus spicheri]KRL49277.1 hypothetical protein FD37_GL000876 [Levilactobacillus spicheri DSM 15429]GEO65705.1 hypothetical protein LSP04_01240 [Levilactobacillus spicheri]
MELSNTLFTVVGALIVALIGYSSAMRVKRQDISSENISQNRQEWRKKLRKIAVKDSLLSNGDYQQILGNINPYHAEKSKRSFFMRDQHIKNAINNIEDNIEKSKIVKEYLRLLLKYDWDRSKCEIMGTSRREISDNYISSIALYSVSFSDKGQKFMEIFKGTDWSQESIKEYAFSLSSEEKKAKIKCRNSIIYIVLATLFIILAFVSTTFTNMTYYSCALVFALPSVFLGTWIIYFTKEKIIFSIIIEVWYFLAVCVLISFMLPSFNWNAIPFNARPGCLCKYITFYN